jgi:hypothetical protein
MVLIVLLLETKQKWTVTKETGRWAVVVDSENTQKIVSFFTLPRFVLRTISLVSNYLRRKNTEILSQQPIGVEILWPKFSDVRKRLPQF